MSYPTLSDLRQRVAYLRGETDYTTTEAVIDSHINAAQRDIVIDFPYSWNLTTSTLTLSAGTATLPADYNPKWQKLKDARISDTQIFTLRNPADRHKYTADDYIYWITYDVTTKRYIFNSLTLTGSVLIYYWFFPATMTAANDAAAQAVYPLVPDTEALAYLAASKNWVGDERNVQLSREYRAEASTRIQSMRTAEYQMGPDETQGSIVDYNPELAGGVADFEGLNIALP